jgi:hypothetical protein
MRIEIVEIGWQLDVEETPGASDFKCMVPIQGVAP